MELKVGDRVRLTEYGLIRFSKQSEGGEGEIVENRYTDYEYPHCVQWDCREDSVCVYTPKDLELADVNEEELYY